MCSPPSRGWTKQQARLLADIKGFDRKELKPCSTLVTTLLGKSVECSTPRHDHAQEERQRQERAIQKLALARKAAGKDKYPCKVADGLYIGAVGAARNLKALQKCGITHIINASPAVPCFFREHGSFQYHSVDLYDDAEADLLTHVDAANTFIDEARQGGGAVLVHCYAGQSRSAALVMAFLMARGGRDMVSAWGMVRKVRPIAKPNSGFLRQLAQYGTQLGREGAFEVA